jgi:hypothetical protein
MGRLVGIGGLKNIRGIIGSWRFISTTFLISILEEWIRSSRPCKNLLVLVRLSSVVVTIKKWRKNMEILSIS